MQHPPPTPPHRKPHHQLHPRSNNSNGWQNLVLLLSVLCAVTIILFAIWATSAHRSRRRRARAENDIELSPIGAQNLHSNSGIGAGQQNMIENGECSNGKEKGTQKGSSDADDIGINSQFDQEGRIPTRPARAYGAREEERVDGMFAAEEGGVAMV